MLAAFLVICVSGIAVAIGGDIILKLNASVGGDAVDQALEKVYLIPRSQLELRINLLSFLPLVEPEKCLLFCDRWLGKLEAYDDRQ